jgi:putative Flp pilus-assembly TadE/G-like protein/putative Tad-like protein involved in Flp pilus assembly
MEEDTMCANSGAERRNKETGATLYFVAGAMAVLLAISALAIDLVSAYVARGEAQRAADAAALAGATVFVTQGCTTAGSPATGVTGCVAGGPQEAPAIRQAQAVAAQNTVGGQAANVLFNSTSPTDATKTDIVFSYPTAQEPQISVTVQRTKARGNALPTFFAKIFGVTSMDVVASATAEAYNPTSGDTSVGVSCVRPWLLPNCDASHPVPGTSPEANKNCGGTGNNDGITITCPSGTGTCYPSYFFDPGNKNAIVNPGLCTWNAFSNPPAGTPPGYCSSSSGSVGGEWALHSQSGPSQYYAIAFTGQSGSTYEQNIESCETQLIACNDTLNSLNGKKVGKTDQGVENLIHASNGGLSQGQDSICAPATSPACTTGIPPFTITGGSNNPYGLSGKTFYSPSDSIANVVVYCNAGTASGTCWDFLAPGGSSVKVVGYMQLFVEDVIHSGTDDEIDTIITSIGGCGTTKANPAPVVTSTGGGSFIPIRLIRCAAATGTGTTACAKAT